MPAERALADAAVPLDVLGDDAAFGTGAGDGAEIDAALARDASRERRGLDAPAASFPAA